MRDFYVTLRRQAIGKVRTAFLAGPFETRAEALAVVTRAATEAEAVDPRAFWDAHGTCSLPRQVGNPIGKLNERLGLKLISGYCK